MELAMREMSVRDANQNFSQVIAAAEHGETIIITKNGTPVARIAPAIRNGGQRSTLSRRACGRSVPPDTGSARLPRTISMTAIRHDPRRA
jgi:prevent-host-death family protein